MADNAHKLTDKRLEIMEKHLSQIYERASKEIEEKADTYFRKFKEKDKKQHEKLKNGDITEQDYKNWRQGQIMIGKHWESMRDELVQQYKNVSATSLAYINGEMPDIYTLNYNAFEETAKKINGYSFELVDQATVKALATENKTFLPYKTVNNQKFERWCTKKINAEVLQGILQGESIPNMAKRLRTVTEMNKTASVRNARTMATSAENKGRMDSFAKAEADGIILQKRWIAARDARTRDWHAELDGQLKDKDEPFINSMGEIMYPGDPHADPANTYNCRCTLGSKILGFKKLTKSSTDLTFSAKSDKMNIGLQFFASNKKQFGKKVGKHAKDFGLDPSNDEDREKFNGIIDNIIGNSEEIRIGEWRGQTQEVLFHILKDDVVITNQQNEFISILKGGVNNARVKNARKK